MRAARSPEVPSASMADVAFLLLLFFLVATAIRSDSGLPFDLAPIVEPVPVDAVLPILVGANGTMYVSGAPASKADVRAEVAARGRLVQIRSHRRTPYAATVAALDAVRLGFQDADRAPRIAMAEPVGAEDA